jgi:hypothetical protein
MLQEKPRVTIRPIINYPPVAEVGKSYLLTVDVRMEGTDMNEWSYQEEEYPITCILETGPLFKYTTAGGREPVLLLHRFGSTYGPVRFLLTAARKPHSGQIVVTLVNEFGVPIDFIFLHCEVKETISQEERTGAIDTGPRVPPAIPAPAVERPLTSEQQLIEAQLQQARWQIQAYDPRQSYIDLRAEAESGIAVRNFNGSENYVLFVSSETGPVGIIQVYRTGVALAGLERKVAISDILDRPSMAAQRDVLPFVYISTGYVTRFTNDAEPNARSREVFTFHQPQTLNDWLLQIPPGFPQTEPTTLQAQLRHMPRLPNDELNVEQHEAILKLERSLAENRPRALVRMASGRNRTVTIIHTIFRLLRLSSTRRILYLVDSIERVSIVERAFGQYLASEKNRSFSEEKYPVQRLEKRINLPPRSVIIGDIQTLSDRQSRQGGDLLVVEENQRPGDERSFSDENLPQITYNPSFPIEMFDFIFIDGLSAELYKQGKPLLEYFDAFLIGFSSLIDDPFVTNFFQRNLVYSARMLPLKQRQWVVAVGIDEYQDERIHSLQGSVHDATLFRRLAENNSDTERIHLLASGTPEPPTLQNILKALQQFARETKRDDLLIFYFSGHGELDKNSGEGFLIAQDSQADALGETALSLEQLRQIMKSAPAEASLLILDTCYVGLNVLEKEETHSRSSEFVERAVEEIQNMVVMASCAEDEFSYEYHLPSGTQGIFTHFLLEALSGRGDVDDKGFVTVTDAFKYVSSKMKAVQRESRRRQTPTMLSSQMGGEIILGRY